MDTPETSYDPDEDLLLVGRVVQAHGVRGELKVAPETDDPERLAELSRVFLGRTPHTARPMSVERVRFQQTKRGPLALVKLEGVDSMDDALATRGLYLLALEEDLPPLDEDEVFIHDLIGLRVEREDGELIGSVKEVLQQPAHEVLIVERPEGADAFIPAVEDFVLEVDLEAERVVVRPIEGMLE